MKLICILTMAVLPLTLLAQTNTTVGLSEISLEMGTRKAVIQLPSISNAEIIHGGVTYAGIGVQLLLAEQPLQLLNPLAPKSYGTGDQNLVSDVITKRPVGLKLFSINF